MIRSSMRRCKTEKKRDMKAKCGNTRRSKLALMKVLRKRSLSERRDLPPLLPKHKENLNLRKKPKRRVRPQPQLRRQLPRQPP
jgi:hypothetical protein